MLPMHESARATSYYLCAATKCAIPSQGKGTIETGLVVSLPSGTYARVAPHSGLAAKNFIDIGVGVVDLDYLDKINAILFNHSAKTLQSRQMI